MEAIDAGDIPLEEVLREILTQQGLDQLVGQNVACFALARRAFTSDLFEALIANVEAIDHAMREHVAFIVFHGSRSDFTRHELHERHYRNARYRVLGLSVSKAARPHDRPLPRHWYFDDEMMLAVRAGRLDAREAVACSTEMATSVLLRSFQLRESSLPCLVFVSAETLDTPIVVPLSETETVASLYADVLQPLSDAFDDFQDYWTAGAETRQRREALKKARSLVDEASKLQAASAARVAEARQASEAMAHDKALIARAERERQRLIEIQDRVHRSDFLMQQAELLELPPETAAAFLELKGLENAKRAAGHPNDLADRNRLGTEINRRRSALAAALIGPKRKLAAAIDAPVSEATLALRRAEEKLEAAIAAERRLNEEVSAARELAAGRGQEDIEAAAASAQACLEVLRARGFADDAIKKGLHRPITIIEDLAQRGRFETIDQREPHRPIRILVVASNPMDEQRLDLEAETRALELEITSAGFQHQIEPIVKHGVQPNDLIRHLRKFSPQVLHFSGHGVDGGILLRSDGWDSLWASPESLARVLGGRGVRLLVLNACFTNERADILAKGVQTVVGTTAVVGDEAARRFSTAFYNSLCSGYTVREAFRDGGDAVDLYGLDDVYHCVGESDWALVGSR